jgi:outer membrane protein TolC
MEVLDAERKLFALQNQLTIAKAQTSQNLIAVYKSLGGGWKPLEMSAAEGKLP